MNIQKHGMEKLSPRTAESINSLFEVIMLLLKREVANADVEFSISALLGNKVVVIKANTDTLWIEEAK